MSVSKRPIGRRAVLGAIPATLIAASCSRSKAADVQKFQTSGRATARIDHSLWDGLLAKYVTAAPDGINRVDYAALQSRDAAALKSYLDSLQRINIGNFPKNEQFAFWVNLYNAATIDIIIESYPLPSIRDLGLFGQGPWKEKILKISGDDLSLDDVEHGILRPIWQDVRIHYAVNCASIGCPNLAARAYTADRLETMLEDAARSYINHPRGFARSDGMLTASSIFDWYVDDWGDAEAVLDHARDYAAPATLDILSSAKEIDRYDYDWSLNDVTRP